MAELKKINVNDSQQPESDTQQQEAKKSAKKQKTSNFFSSLPWPKILLVTAVIAAGIGTGYGVHSLTSSGSSKTNTIKTASPDGKISQGDTFGVEDPGETFPDEATGVLVKGGVDGEGSHHIMRAPDASQNVYLTSTVVDLDQFIGHKVKIWGQTNDARKAGWLMDVGKIKIVELDADKPF